MKNLTIVFNYRVLVVSVITLFAFYICSLYDIKLKTDFTIISIAIIFPLVFTITGAFQKRQEAIKYFSDFRSNLIAISDYFKVAVTNGMPKRAVTEVNSILKEISDQNIKSLKNTEDSDTIDNVRDKIADIRDKIITYSKFLNEKERDSLVNLKKELSKCSENLNSLSEHGTPRSLRAYCLVFIYIFPFIFVPGIYQYDISQTEVINSSLIMFISLLISFILVALYNVQNLIENPFDNQGLDDIKTDIYNKLNREIG